MRRENTSGSARAPLRQLQSPTTHLELPLHPLDLLALILLPLLELLLLLDVLPLASKFHLGRVDRVGPRLHLAVGRLVLGTSLVELGLDLPAVCGGARGSQQERLDNQWGSPREGDLHLVARLAQASLHLLARLGRSTRLQLRLELGDVAVDLLDLADEATDVGSRALQGVELLQRCPEVRELSSGLRSGQLGSANRQLWTRTLRETHIASLDRSGTELPLLLVNLALDGGDLLLDESRVGEFEGQQALELSELLLPPGERLLVVGELGGRALLLALALHRRRRRVSEGLGLIQMEARTHVGLEIAHFARRNAAIAPHAHLAALALVQHRLVKIDKRLMLRNLLAVVLGLLLGFAHGTLDRRLVRVERVEASGDLGLVGLGRALRVGKLLLGDVDGRLDLLQFARRVTAR